MNKIELKDTTLTVFTQTATEIPSTPLNGSLSITGEGPTFVQTVSKPRPEGNPKLYDGEYISLFMNKEGQLVPHTKRADLLKVKDMKQLKAAFAKDLKKVMEIVSNIKSQNK